MVKQQKKESYLKFIENSVEANAWRNFYAEAGGAKKDILKNGDLSCAFFVSSVLLIFGLAGGVRFTVKGTIRELKQNGWKEIKKLKPGAVLIWEKNKMFSHTHIGFCFDEKIAISNYFKKKMPFKHHITYGTRNGQPARRIVKIFWHQKLDKA